MPKLHSIWKFRSHFPLQWPIKGKQANIRHKNVRILGIDPGLQTTGWGIIDVAGSRLAHVANGHCKAGTDDLGARLLSLFDQLTDIVNDWHPTEAAVEQTFVNRDGAGTLKLGQARGIAMLVPARAGLRVGEYAPNAVKKTVVGVGHADKRQVDHMVRLHLPGAKLAGSDAADALAIAICHAHHPPKRIASDGSHPKGLRMIGRLTGRLAYKALDHVMIDVGGVGYLVMCSDRTLAALPAVGEAVSLYTDLLVREDLLQLYGFTTVVEKEWHRLLMSVQGIGAKASLALLGALGPDGISRAIVLGDWAALKSAKGVGPKTAQRVVNELKDKAPSVMALGDGPSTAAAAVPPTDDTPATPLPPIPAAAPNAQTEALSALGNLGYTPPEAARAVTTALGDVPDADTTTLIRLALKALAPKG